MVTHTVSSDGLTLTSQTIINWKKVTVISTWKTKALAVKNYEKAIKDAETHLNSK